MGIDFVKISFIFYSEFNRKLTRIKL